MKNSTIVEPALRGRFILCLAFGFAVLGIFMCLLAHANRSMAVPAQQPDVTNETPQKVSTVTVQYEFSPTIK